MNLIRIMRKRESSLRDQAKRIEHELSGLRVAINALGRTARTANPVKKRALVGWTPERRARYMATVNKRKASKKKSK